MVKKIELSIIRQKFVSDGATLLTTEYVNNNTRLEFVCACGNTHTTNWMIISKGSACRCRQCTITVTKLSKLKYTEEEVSQILAKKGCRLIKYTNTSIKLDYICRCGNEHSTTLGQFQRNKGCNKCGYPTGENHYNWNPNKTDCLKTYKRARYLLRHSLNATGQRKSSRTKVMLGYSRQDLENHLTSYPNWGSVKDGDWHIDHIFPIKAFIDYGIKDVKIINALDNLRPLSRTENLSKNDSYNIVEFEAYLRTINIPFESKVMSHTKFSKELVLKHFPTKEAIVFNLNIAVELAAQADTLPDSDRIDFLCDCHRALQVGDVKKAIELSERAGYSLMASAIKTHWDT